MTSTWKTHGIIGLLAVALLLTGCGKKDQDQATGSGSSVPSASPSASSGQVPDMAQTEAQTRQALAQMNQGATVEALPPATMKDFLPAELPGLARADISAERMQMGGADLSVAQAQYQAADGDASIDVTITDVGNLTGPMKMGMAAWAMAQYSRETDTGYEKTTTYNGYKAMEEYDNEAREGALRVFVADRFVVEVRGSDVTMDAIKQAMGKIDLTKLAAAK